jgi:hypothetical protein
MSVRSRLAPTLALPLAIAIALACLLALATPALAIDRATVLARAQSWIDKPVAYSQAKYHLGYRTDCSGYVSMCWSTGTSWSTSSFHAVTHRITAAQLKPGDAMLKPGYHVRLFAGWTDDTHTNYVAFEAGNLVAVARVHSFADDIAFGFAPTRYNRITDGAPSDERLLNRSFDAWLNSWDPQGDTPAWWTVTGPGTGWDSPGLTLRRTDVHHTGLNSIQLLNPSTDSETTTSISQTASITPGARYLLSAWAKTPSNPGAVSLAVTFLDASGSSIAETSTGGASAWLNDTGFRQMSLLVTAPAGAMSAVVSVQLAGGLTGAVPGTSVVVDDVSLARPRVSVSAQASASSVHARATTAIGGSVSTTCVAGAIATVWAQTPGHGWARLASTTVAVADGRATWNARYTFRRGMRKGVYQFRATVPDFAGWLGATSNTATVKLR